MSDKEGFCYLNTDQFPCDQGTIVLVSMGLAAAGLGLLMVFFLMHQVCFPKLIDVNEKGKST
jgi:hypothetical protein